MENLAPNITRQRIIIEGTCKEKITDIQIKDYLSKLSKELHMITVQEPITHQSERFGWAGWIHWETSGAHFYAWDEPFVFFSVDIYTCKSFDNDHAVSFTKSYFKTTKIAWKAV